VGTRDEIRAVPRAGLSLWADGPDAPARHEPSLAAHTQADVVIVGAGLTGLWTAHTLRRWRPDARVVVLERHRVGHGASGRNGGWCSGWIPVTPGELDAAHGAGTARRMLRRSFAAVDEVGEILRAEGIRCGFHKAGTLMGATTAPQLARVRADVAEAAAHGLASEDLVEIGAADLQARIGAAELRGGSFTPHCATVHPLRLVRGLAEACARRGVVIREGAEVTDIGTGRVEYRCDGERGTVTADLVVRATEGYSATLPGARRDLVPLYSYMVATAPLPPAVREAVRWAGRETYHDGRNLIIYAQLTADGRVAFGGRGAPYHFGSRIRDRFDVHERIHERIVSTMRETLPALREVPITHRWGGPLGVPRAWHPTVYLDRSRRLALVGGYVGEGVLAAHLAARTLVALLGGPDPDLATLPWVGHHWGRWEPEPLRWLGVNGMLRLTRSMDRTEARTGRPDRVREAVRNWFFDR
jgi:glycine/D-amino acid oxidase-like deaminating enzyme